MQIHTYYHMKTMEFHRTAAHQYNIIITPLAGYDAKTLADDGKYCGHPPLSGYLYNNFMFYHL